MSKMNLPSVPRSADRDTTVFLQSLKKAVENLSASDKTELSEAAKSYVLRIDKNTREDLVGVIGDEAGVGAILDKIKGQITESELSIGLGERIAKIDSNEGAINAERQARIAELILTNQAIIDEAAARVQAIKDSSGLLQANIESEALARFNVDAGLRQDLVNEITTRSDETGELITQFNGLYAQANPKMAGDTDGWAGDDSYFAGVWSERSAIIEQGLATAKVTDGLLSNINDNKATITEVNKTLVTKTEVTASQLNRLSAQMVGGYDGNDLQEITSGLIHQERQARATETEGLAQQISLISAGVGEQFDSFEIWHFNKSNDGWTGGVYQDGWLNVKAETLTSPVITLDGSMYKHVKIRIQKFGTPTWQGLLSYAGGSITALEPSYTEDGIALVNFYAQWDNAITSFSLKLASVASASNYFLVDWIAVGRPSPGASNAALLREEKARADKDLAIAQDLKALDVQINGDGASSASSIVQKLTTTATKTDTNATDISGLTSTFNNEMYGAQGVITKNAQTAASAASANASDISGLFVQVNPRMAGDTDRWAGENDPLKGVGVWSERSARIEEGMYTAERFDAMSARVDGNASAITTERNIRATALTALATQTDTLQTTVGQNTSSIQVAQQSINGINARWSIKVDVNGVVGGIALGNNGSTVDFLVRAGSFAIQGPSGSKSVPFVAYPDGTIIDGVVVPAGVYMTDAYIRNAAVDTLMIKGQAITVPANQYTEAAVDFNMGSSEVTINSASLDVKGGSVSIQFSFERITATPSGPLTLRVRRNGALIKTMTMPVRVVANGLEEYKVSGGGDQNDRFAWRQLYTSELDYRFGCIPAFSDTPPAGLNTYSITMQQSSVGTATIKSRSLFLLGAKR